MVGGEQLWGTCNGGGDRCGDMVLRGDGSGKDPDVREVQCGETAGPALLWLRHLVFCRSSHSLESSLQAQLYGRL